MARAPFALLLLLALCAFAASPALARRYSRRLDGSYPTGSSSSSPTEKSPYTSPSSGSSPTTPSTTPSIPIPPVTSTPSPVIIPAVSSTPSGRYGGYGSHTGKGTSGFFGKNPKAIPRLLSLVSSIAKIFGPRLLKFFKGKKSPTVWGALKDTSSLPVPSLAREATASLINSYQLTDFPLSTGQVVTDFNAALDSPELAAQQALKFQQLNEGV